MKKSPSILVIIVTWNKKEYVVDLLNSLLDLDYPKEQLDIVVVDNASTDGTVEALQEQFKNISILENTENLGGCGGFNSGLSFAFEQPEGRYEYLWLLDNDVLVHKNTLAELLTILQKNKDVAIAGSTMMQLTYPWRINEMGAFVDRGRGTLLLNRHQQEVSALRGKTVRQLLGEDIDLSQNLEHCREWMDVDYVAAASLLIRASVARTAGLWDDFFIHFDDVEWCLRIAGMGHRIAVSARSLIWHLPAENKVPTWILYYDNRNVLYLLKKHSDLAAVQATRKWILKKSLYYALLGKLDLSRLLIEAVADFDNGITGKKDIQLDDCYQNLDSFEQIISQSHIKRVLVPWTLDLQACDLQRALVCAMKVRSELRVEYLLPAASTYMKDTLRAQVPHAVPVQLPHNRVKRLLKYLQLRGKYDLVLQSEYQQLLPLSWIGKMVVFVNYEGLSLRALSKLKNVLSHCRVILKIW